MAMKIAVRGYADDQLIFQEFTDVDWDNIADLASSHALLMADFPRHTIEIEFLDEPDPLKRFHRIGTDPSRMVDPRPWKESQ